MFKSDEIGGNKALSNEQKIVDVLKEIDQLKSGLEPGQYKFPFELEVPEWLPTSMLYTQTEESLMYLGNNQLAGISYSITAILGKLKTNQPLILNLRGDNVVNPHILATDFLHLVI